MSQRGLLTAAGLFLFLVLGSRTAEGYERLPQPPFPFYVPDMNEVSRLREMQGFLSMVESGRIRLEPAFFADVFSKYRQSDALQALFFMSFLRESRNPVVRGWYQKQARAQATRNAYTETILRWHAAEDEVGVRMFGLQESNVLAGRLSLDLFENPWQTTTVGGEENDLLFLHSDPLAAYRVQIRRIPNLDESGFLAMVASSPVKQTSESIFEQEVTRRGVFAFSNADRAIIELATGTDERGRPLGTAAVHLYSRRTRTAYSVDHSLSVSERSPDHPIASRLWSQMALAATLVRLER